MSRIFCQEQNWAYLLFGTIPNLWVHLSSIIRRCDDKYFNFRTKSSKRATQENLVKNWHSSYYLRFLARHVGEKLCLPTQIGRAIEYFDTIKISANSCTQVKILEKTRVEKFNWKCFENWIFMKLYSLRTSFRNWVNFQNCGSQRFKLIQFTFKITILEKKSIFSFEISPGTWAKWIFFQSLLIAKVFWLDSRYFSKIFG